MPPPPQLTTVLPIPQCLVSRAFRIMGPYSPLLLYMGEHNVLSIHSHSTWLLTLTKLRTGDDPFIPKIGHFYRLFSIWVQGWIHNNQSYDEAQIQKLYCILCLNVYIFTKNMSHLQYLQTVPSHWLIECENWFVLIGWTVSCNRATTVV